MKWTARSHGRERSGARTRRKKAWVALRGVSWPETAAALRAAHLIYLPLIFIAGIVSLFSRALRWGVLLGPIATVRRRSLFAATAIGFAANMLLPLRAGEVLRPWILARKEATD